MESILHGVQGSCTRTRSSSSGASSSSSTRSSPGSSPAPSSSPRSSASSTCEAVKPTYRLALLTALAFLLVAPLPLQLHLGHPERSLEMYLTPHTRVGDGDVRLRLPLVPDGRAACWRSGSTTGKDIVLTWRADARADARWSTGRMALGSDNISAEALAHRRPGRPRSSPSSASRRRSCCTATSGSSSGRSRRTRGGPRR